MEKNNNSPDFGFDLGTNRCSISDPSHISTSTPRLTIHNGQVIYSQCKAIIFFASTIIDTIYVNGNLFGRSESGVPVYILLKPDEIIDELQYSRDTNGSDRLCEMTVITNINSYHVQTENTEYCGTDRYSVFVPDDEIFFFIFEFKPSFSWKWMDCWVQKWNSNCIKLSG